ncbi:PucR family transcriptional regulator [Amycolatopsis rhabdoformis]|uniref:PucR family transcriptional regulator n=1 Tax=Amycolatopsis rhabdoformis TaxID=1448059 RepID=A0ABZ1IGP2_9PSEU|nr:PucR family transcriptional regulator [Amycolatopsis rhabdoformis]WSE32838.1 PucR family transcriptional regulator [Amycolatopsis rhabdoformis]
MRELAGRMRAVDPGAGAALQVIAHFDALVEARAGLEATVRAAAVLAGCAAGLVVPDRRLRVRVEPDGRRAAGEPGGFSVPLPGYAGGLVWLDRSTDDPGQTELDRVVVERLATAVRIVLDRTGPGLGAGAAGDPAAVELLVDAGTDEPTRLRAARSLSLASGGSFAVTVSCGGARPAGSARLGDLDVTIAAVAAARGTRSATGPSVGLSELPASYEQARLAFRLTADGEPGPSHVDAVALGGLLALAAGCDTPAAVAEVALLERVLAAHPWAPETLTAVAAEPSLRAAAAAVPVHHSTLQARVDVLTAELGYGPATAAGRTRLTIALALRRFRRTR